MVQILEKAKARDSDQITVYPDRTWEQFKHIQQGLEGLPGIKLAYYAGVIEILMAGQAHEIFRKIIGYLIETFLFERNVRHWFR